MPDIFFLIFGIVVGAAGIVLIVAFIITRIKCSESAVASVSRIEKSDLYVRGSKTHRYRPVYSYAVNDKKYECEAPFDTSSAKKYAEGDNAIIFYNPKKPETICFKGRIVPVLWGILFLFIGLFFSVLYFV